MAALGLPTVTGAGQLLDRVSQGRTTRTTAGGCLATGDAGGAAGTGPGNPWMQGAHGGLRNQASAAQPPSATWGLDDTAITSGGKHVLPKVPATSSLTNHRFQIMQPLASNTSKCRYFNYQNSSE